MSKLNKKLNKDNINKNMKSFNNLNKSKNNMYKNNMLTRMNRFDIKKNVQNRKNNLAYSLHY